MQPEGNSTSCVLCPTIPFTSLHADLHLLGPSIKALFGFEFVPFSQASHQLANTQRKSRMLPLVQDLSSPTRQPARMSGLDNPELLVNKVAY